MSTFSVKVAIVPSEPGPVKPAEEAQVNNLTSLFTHNSLLPPNLIPNLTSFDVAPLITPCDQVKDGDTYDHVALMSLLNSVSDNKTFVVYVKTSTVSSVDSNSLVKLIYDLSDGFMKTPTTDKSHFDLMYLAKWSDRCDLQRSIGTVFNKTVNLVETSAPHGIQAVLISPDGITKLKAKLANPIGYPVSFALTRLIGDNFLKALTTSPNVMSFGAQYATTSIDYVKTHECEVPPDDNGKPTPKSSNLTLFIFIIVFLVVVAVFYFFIRMVTPPTGGMMQGAGNMAGGMMQGAGGMVQGVGNMAGGMVQGVGNMAGGMVQGVGNMAGGMMY
jgi:hypothetical protein